MKTRFESLLLMIALAVVRTTAATTAAENFGHLANPTGDPVGGGAGYRNIFSKGDFTVTAVGELIAALKQARPGQVIYVPDSVTMDLTDAGALRLPAGVTLAGSRGRNGSAGALLISKHPSSMMFATGGDRVRVTGLRFEGAYGGAERVSISSHFFGILHYACEVDNCEIYNFNLSGVSVGPGALKTSIHHNSMHHIQLGGYGYAVSNGGSDTRIIANRLDFGRHVIASSGSPGCGYEAAYNWVGPNATSHQFDMHGGRDRGDGTDIAGDWLHIHHNTFEGTVRHVVIRGVPSQRAEIHHNWFSGPAATKIVSGGNMKVYCNVYGPDKKLEP
ncbi:MAG: hypothetical protein WA117_20435 [Verrucomicrobiia bacterium]